MVSAINHTFAKPFHVAEKSFNFFEKFIWKGIKQTGKIAKGTMKIVVLKTPKIASRMNMAIAGVGLLSGIGLLMTVKSIPSHIQTLLSNLSFHDVEGAVISVVDLIANPFDALSSISTITSSLHTLGAIPMIGFFSLIALPLAIGLLSYSVIRSSYLIIRNAIFLAQLPKTTEGLKTMIDQKLPDHSLERHTDKKVVNIMRNMQKHFETNPHDDATANKAIKDIRTLMVRKIVVNSLGTLANIAMLVLLAVSTTFALSPLAVPIVSAGKAGIMLAKHIYTVRFYDKGLHLPEFAK